MAEQLVKIEGTVPVTGTLAPSGTQNVAITGQPIAVTQSTTPTAPVYVTQAGDPQVTGVYGFCLPDTPGVVAANTFVTLFNPVGSGKTVVVSSATVSAYVAGGGNTQKASLIGVRVTTATGGTLQAASTINKLRTSYANPVAEVRTANPTITAGANVVAFPPPIGTDTASNSERVVASTGTSLVLVAGEGIAFRTAAGDTDENFDISFSWSEI